MREGDVVEAGKLIGHVGTVLNSDKIDEASPLYIRKLKHKNTSMLHFELGKQAHYHSQELSGRQLVFRRKTGRSDGSYQVS